MWVIEEMGRAFTHDHLPTMHEEAVHTWGKGGSQLRGIGIKGIQHRSINAPFTSACKARSGSSAPMNATVMAGGPRGIGRCVIYGYGMGFTMHIQGLFCLFLQPLALLVTPSVCLSVGATPLPAYGLPLAVQGFNSALSIISVSGIETLLGLAVMVRPRQRMLSRRGTS